MRLIIVRHRGHTASNSVSGLADGVCWARADVCSKLAVLRLILGTSWSTCHFIMLQAIAKVLRFRATISQRNNDDAHGVFRRGQCISNQ